MLVNTVDTDVEMRKLLSMFESADSCKRHSSDAQQPAAHAVLQLPPPAPFIRKSRAANYAINTSTPAPLILNEQFTRTATNQEQEIASKVTSGSSNYEMLFHLLDTDYPDLVPTSVGLNTEN